MEPKSKPEAEVETDEVEIEVGTIDKGLRQGIAITFLCLYCAVAGYSIGKAKAPSFALERRLDRIEAFQAGRTSVAAAPTSLLT